MLTRHFFQESLRGRQIWRLSSGLIAFDDGDVWESERICSFPDCLGSHLDQVMDIFASEKVAVVARCGPLPRLLCSLGSMACSSFWVASCKVAYLVTFRALQPLQVDVIQFAYSPKFHGARCR